jgi:2-polyprenyl-3-methyl-5-hydroxy-6-metoxy-1,4-benzoquinol methylase
MGAIAETVLYHLARTLSTSEIAHSADMKEALASEEASARYRAAEVSRVVEAMRRYGLRLEGADVLDLGCADGALTRQYAKLGPQSVLGVDVDREAIAKAQQDPDSDPRVEFRLSDTVGIPAASDSIDLILSHDVWEHIENPASLLAECRRVLRPGGRLLLSTWGWWHPFAPHLWSTMPVPYAHLFVSERTLLRACRRVYHSRWYSPTLHDFDANGQRRTDKYLHEAIPTDYLNKYLVRDFERVFRESGMDWMTDLQPFGKIAWSRPLLRVPIVRELLHGSFWAVLTKLHGR